MKIKEILRGILKKLLNPNAIEANEPIEPDEVLSRFLFQSNHFSSNGIKQAAFLPAKNLETSVFRKTKLEGCAGYSPLKKKISKERGKSIKGAALIKTERVKLAEGLEVNADESHHKWHANIEGWPAEKYKQKKLALILAKNSSIE